MPFTPISKTFTPLALVFIDQVVIIIIAFWGRLCDSVNGLVAKKLMTRANEEGPAVLAHVDGVAIDLRMPNTPKGQKMRLVRAHTGIGGAPAGVVQRPERSR